MVLVSIAAQDLWVQLMQRAYSNKNYCQGVWVKKSTIQNLPIVKIDADVTLS